ncbi:SDR family oxidoreductase [Arcobacter cloacae]|uniref:Short-chain dehydrogenase n=1 Tax=Arcobacter cloacae TaxID=1054034 RepID=A0A4Q0ZH86_9BACT|nr:SDR family oxidoreductase [Arcobacter cloacae]RXJ84381.1 hypothetical protein CRU90_05795 [Arcobacter cloacae]
MVELNNKKILVMGASGFIGTQTAIKLSQLGAKVIISGRDKEKLKKTLHLLKGNDHNLISFDITNLDKIPEFVKSVVDLDNQKLSGLVYCNAIFPIRPLKNVTHEFLHNMMVINYYGFVELIRCFSDKRVCEKGSIVTLSSYASNYGDKGQLAYSATKGAMDSSVIVMAKELQQKKIRINAIRPAALLPEDIEFCTLPISIQKLIKDMGTGPINPINIAEQIAFLLSDYSSGMTGKCLDVKGYLV